MDYGANVQMNSEYKDFIGYYSNVYEDGFCRHLITEFERLAHLGAGSNRQQSEDAFKHVKDDYQIFINLRNHSLLKFKEADSDMCFYEGLQRCFDEYSNKYSILKEGLKSGALRCTSMKLQRTSPGGGYHAWHSEQGPSASANRSIVYALYLNSLLPEEAGETEYLYQQKRVRPEENMLVLWPASYTHAHRGNPVFGTNHKYIVTGWFYYD